MKRNLKKLYKGLAEVRDYDVQECIHNKESLKIIYNFEIMTLSPVDLMNKLVKKSTTTFESKVGGKNYKLCAYDWNPDETDY